MAVHSPEKFKPVFLYSFSLFFFTLLVFMEYIALYNKKFIAYIFSVCTFYLIMTEAVVKTMFLLFVPILKGLGPQ